MTALNVGEVEHELREAVGGLLDTRCGLVAVRRLAERDPCWDTGLWRELAGMGVVGLATPADVGGEGGGMALACAVQEELGRRLAPVPVWSSLTGQALLLAAGGTAALERLPAVTSGEVPVTVVVGRGVDGWGVADSVGAEQDAGGGWSLTGEVPVVAEAAGAGLLLVAARGPDGPQWFGVARTEGVRVRPLDALDPTRPLSAVAFDAVPAEPLAPAGDFGRILAAARRTALIALAADAVGVAAAATGLAVEYAKERRQFERPIGSFQAVSHRLADMFLGVETARALVRAAADALDEHDPAESAATASGTGLDIAAALAASSALDAAVAAAQGCVQVHGGMGFTWEHAAHSYLRRAKADEALVALPDRLRDQAAGLLVDAARRRAAQ